MLKLRNQTDAEKARADLGAATRTAESLVAEARSENRDLDTTETRIVERSLDHAEELRTALADWDHAQNRGWSGSADGGVQINRGGTSEGGETVRRTKLSEGVLQRGQTLVEFASRGDRKFADEADELSLARILRGATTGDWSGAELETRAMSSNPGSAGGFLVPTSLASAVLDLARANSVVVAAGATVLPIDGPTDVARLDGDLVSNWKTELAPGIESNAVFGSMQFRPKTVTSHCRMSLELAADGPGSEAIIRYSMAQSIARAIDYAALSGTGTAPEPRGLRNIAGVATYNVGSEIDSWHILQAYRPVRTANYEPSALIAHSRSLTAMQAQRDSTGQPKMLPAVLAQLPMLHSSAIRHDLAPGGTGSEAYLGDFTQLYVGLRLGLQIEVQRDLRDRTLDVLVATWARADIQIARPSAFCILTNVLD
jgi:HK97 family phage major capsid protein